jgi:uncharacterized protein YcaQ
MPADRPTSNLPARRGGLFPTKTDRQVERAREHVNVRATVAALCDRAEIVRIRETTKCGMRAACDISAEEALLAPSDPLVQARVRVIADAGALCIAGVVKDAAEGF